MKKLEKYFKDNHPQLSNWVPHPDGRDLLVYFMIFGLYPDEYSQKIPAIKLWRAITNSGLKDSKEFVELLEARNYIYLTGFNRKPPRSLKYPKLVEDCRGLFPDLFAKLKMSQAKSLLMGEPSPFIKHWWVAANIIAAFKTRREIDTGPWRLVV